MKAANDTNLGLIKASAVGIGYRNFRGDYIENLRRIFIVGFDNIRAATAEGQCGAGHGACLWLNIMYLPGPCRYGLGGDAEHDNKRVLDIREP